MKEHDTEYWTLLSKLASELSERTDAASRDRIALRDAVCAFVAAERTRGTPVGSVIQTVKKILREAEQKSMTSGATDELATQLVAWCKEFHRSAGTMIS